MHVVGILLAAGRGRRFGGDKLLAPLEQPPPGMAPGTGVGIAAAMRLACVLPDSIGIVRSGDPRLAGALRAAGLRVVECANADDGMSASLACGVDAARDAGACVIALADMPWTSPATIRAVVDALTGGADIVVPAYRGRRGHPVGFARRFFPALRALRGDAGARSLIVEHDACVVSVEVDDPGVLQDVDLPGDLRPGVSG